jgi:hypothetical protein
MVEYVTHLTWYYCTTVWGSTTFMIVYAHADEMLVVFTLSCACVINHGLASYIADLISKCNGYTISNNNMRVCTTDDDDDVSRSQT